MKQMTKRHCTAITAKGEPCKNWAVHGSSPPLCGTHGGGKSRPGPPLGSQNALKHGHYAALTFPELIGEQCNIDAIILNLYQRQQALNTYINLRLEGTTPSTPTTPKTITSDELAYLLQIHGQNASRLGRLLRDRKTISPESSEGLTRAIDLALNELANRLGTKT